MKADPPYKPLDCGLYDYLEVACLYAYELELELRDGSSAHGVAKTIEQKNGAEFLVLKAVKSTEYFRLDTLASLTVKSLESQFDSLSF